MAENELKLIEYLLDKAKTYGADRADGVSFDSSDVGVTIRNGEIESLERSESKGFGLRVLVGQRQAIVSSSDISKDSLDELAKRAVDMAKIAPEDKYVDFASSSMLATDIAELELFDKNEPSEQTLIDRARIAEETALAVSGITNTEGADSSYGKNRVVLATSLGFLKEYQASSSSISVSVLAGEGTGMERDYDYTVARFSSDLDSPEKIGKEAATRALKRLNPKIPKSCKVPVIFDKRISRSLVGNFAAAINGSSIARGTSFLKDKMGQNIFSANVNIINDPFIKRGLGSKPFDAEGVKGQRLELIKDGVLTTWVLDIRSANQLNLKTNGCATRGLASPPSPSTSNLYMENGKLSLQDLISGIKSGFYVTETFGMGVNLLTGDYSQGAAGFWIENGEIAYPVSEITIASTLQHIFENLIPANDLEMKYGTNAPTVRVDGITVAGK